MRKNARIFLATALLLAAVSVVVSMLERNVANDPVIEGNRPRSNVAIDIGRSGVANADAHSSGRGAPTTKLPAPTPDAIPYVAAYERISSEYPRVFSVSWPDGDLPGPALDALRSAEIALERGEPAAGVLMYKSIVRCRDNEFEDRQRELERSANDPENYERLLTRNETALRDCAGVGRAEIARGYAGLKEAATRGDVASQLYYSSFGAEPYMTSTTNMLASADQLVEFRHDAIRFLDSAAAHGSIQAISALSNTYDFGILATRDEQKSYMYGYAAYLIERDSIAEQIAARLAKPLTAEQIDVARQQARQFLERCCR
jgi:hypothetical protein